MTVARIIHIFLGIIYSAIGVSLFSNLYNFFDKRISIPPELPLKWLLWLVIPPLVISVLDKLRVIFMPKEHEDTLRDQILSPTSLFAETIAWCIPNIIGGVLWAVGILIAYAIAMYLADVHYVSQLADYLGLTVAEVKF